MSALGTDAGTISHMVVSNSPCCPGNGLYIIIMTTIIIVLLLLLLLTIKWYAEGEETRTGKKIKDREE